MAVKLIFKLKQHTPMIHFLHDQPGATLRATELKPKLDNFLIRHAFGNDFEQYKTYLSGWKEGKRKTDFERKKSFDYKIKIEPPQTGCILDIEQIFKKKGFDKVKQFPLFFGNLGEEKKTEDQNEKKFVFSFDPFPVTFFSFNQDILGHIQKYFAAFLFQNNFGTRQSKGFGSFFLEGNEQYHQSPGVFPTRFHFSVKPRSLQTRANKEEIYQHFYYLFSNIDLLYKALRSGINHNLYFKSLMFMYCKQYGIQWEKKTIKEKYFPQDLRNQIKEHSSSDILEFFSDSSQALMKDLLGLSSTEVWGSYRSSLKSGPVISKENPDIDRFKSPITFKILKRNNLDVYDIFLHTTEIDKGFLQKEFFIKKDGQGDLKLKTPIAFNVDHFLAHAFSKVDLKKHVQNPLHQKSREFKTICGIFKEIRTNLKA